MVSSSPGVLIGYNRLLASSTKHVLCCINEKLQLWHALFLHCSLIPECEGSGWTSKESVGICLEIDLTVRDLMSMAAYTKNRKSTEKEISIVCRGGGIWLYENCLWWFWTITISQWNLPFFFKKGVLCVHK